MEVCFILINPARGEHIGFAARALKTMGFSQLRVVNSQAHLLPTARKTAYGAHDILDGVEAFPHLEDACADLSLTIGTTAKRRIKRYDYHLPSELTAILKSKYAQVNKVGLLFGSEENGLSTAELEYCDLISSIPKAVDYPSLNLSQAILIYAWELNTLPSSEEIKLTANTSLQQVLKEDLTALLGQLGFDDKPILQRRILDRLMTLNASDMELAATLMSKLKHKMDQ